MKPIILSLILFTLAFIGAASLSTAPEVYPYITCRQGYTMSNHTLDYYGATVLNRVASGSTYDYDDSSPSGNPTGQEIYRMVWVQGSGPTGQTYTRHHTNAWYQAIAQANPGSLWLVGNEVENPFQANFNPETYARAYKETRDMLLSYDPTARVSIAGVTQATPLRLQWLDRMLTRYYQNYGPVFPTSVFTVHGYQFREVAGSWGAGIPVGLTATVGISYTWSDTISSAKFIENVVRFRTWMNAKGFRAKALYITEYGPSGPDTYPGGWAQVASYTLTETMGYMTSATSSVYGYQNDSNRLVQRWNFFALDLWPAFGGSYLVNEDKTLSPLGLSWEKYVRSPLSRLAPCKPGLENAVKQVFAPLQRLQNVGVIYP